MKMSTHAAGAVALVSVLLPFAAFASDPASHEVTAPAVGQSVTVEWTGTALPGATSAPGSAAQLAADVAGEQNVIGCPPVGADDSHNIVLTIPDGLVGQHVVADFQITWEEGDTIADAANSRDIGLSVYQDIVTLMGHSDGGSPSEAVSIDNPASATYTAVVCPFTVTEPVPYHGRLTVTTLEPNACTPIKGNVIPNAPHGGSLFPQDPEARGLPNFDAFTGETFKQVKPMPNFMAGRLQNPIVDYALGQPTFLWARTDATPAAVGALAPRELLIAHGRAQLRAEAKELHLTNALIDEARVTDAGFNGDGPAVVRFNQSFNGLDVYNRSLNVVLARDFRPVAVSGYFATDFNRSTVPAFALDAAQAVAAGWTHLGGALDAARLVPAREADGWQWFERPAVTGTHVFERGPRARAVYYARNGALEPAYHVELLANARQNGNLLAYALVVSAVDGRVLHRENLKADAFSYRVYADTKGPLYQPYDSPLGNDGAPFPTLDRSKKVKRVKAAASSLITLDNAGIKTGDPWLADDATTTSGNNVNACKDTYDASASTPAGTLGTPGPINFCVSGLEPPTAATGDHAFDYDDPADSDPSTDVAIGHAIVNLFYMNNWLHDWWYNHGFDEAAGNAQKSNYGRGGKEGDPIQAQGQDGSGRNNANMATPADSSSPIMQQYIFDGPILGEVRVTAPYTTDPLTFTIIHDTGKDNYDIDGTAQLANDGQGVSPSDGCGPAYPWPEAVSEQGLPIPLAPVAPPDRSLAGKIAIVDRGNCNTTYKIQFALASGAAALVVVNNVDGDPPNNIGNLDIPLSPVEPTGYAYDQMPTVIIRKDAGDRIKAALAAGETVTMHMDRTPSVDVDGTRDNQIIAHEFFHYVHHRLTASSNDQSRAMSEGWGDIDAFLLTVRPEDVSVPGNAEFGGAYGLASYVTDNFFAGIRRAPYTVSFADNGYTLRHIAKGEVEPNGGNGANNAEVHAAGEIWANEMFNCYVGLLNRHSFADARSRMQDYIVAGFKMTPADATYTEQRDAVLAAALAADPDDYAACSRGFAARGNGLNAVAPARSSSDFTGVVEDFTPFVCASGNGGKTGDGSGGEGTGVVLGGAFGFATLLPLFGLALLPRRRRRH